MRVDGHRLGYSVPAVVADVEKGASFMLSLNFEAPCKCGHYSTGFCLMSPDRKLFGEKVWCDIIVEDSTSDAMRVSMLMELDNDE